MDWAGWTHLFFRPEDHEAKMKNENAKRERIEQNILDAVNSCRGGVMDIFQIEIGPENPAWKLIRARLLRAFGDGGLTGRIAEILNTEFGENQ